MRPVADRPSAIIVSAAKRHLLIIDDYASLAKFVPLVAHEEGFDVEMMRAEEFMSAVARAPPDVIILDIVMRKVDGSELIRWLAVRTTKVHVILVTGFNLEYASRVRQIGMAHGIDSIAILLKPFRVAPLRAVLTGSTGWHTGGLQ